MDYSKVLENKHVTVYEVFDGNSSNFFQEIKVPFVPDFMVVRGIHYGPNETDANDIYTVWCDLVDDSIGSFSVDSIITLTDASTQTTTDNKFSLSKSFEKWFKLGKSVNGNIRFRMKNTLEDEVDMGGNLAIHLEFIKVKDK